MTKYIFFKIFTFFLMTSLTVSCLSNDNSSKNTIKIQHELNQFIKNKPYTILYIWTSWCGISRNGLINDYYKNYEAINNDTVQSMLIVMSDTNAINDFLVKNTIDLPYTYINPGQHSILSRNSKDEENKNKFALKEFNYVCQAPGFPSVLLVNNELKVQLEGSETKDALNYYRKIEKLKAQ